MTESEINELLQRKDQWMTLSTIGRDGFPHSVPLGYFLHHGRLIMGCRDATQKVLNVERNPQVCLLWENGRQSDEMIGIMVQGHARVVRDDAERLALKQEACRQRGEEAPDSVGGGFVYIEVAPHKTVSWRRPRR